MLSLTAHLTDPLRVIEGEKADVLAKRNVSIVSVLFMFVFMSGSVGKIQLMPNQSNLTILDMRGRS